jgi:hypothetical protein
MSPETLADAIIGELIDADEQRIGPRRDLEGIADMIAVGMGEDNEIGNYLGGCHRGGGIAVKKGIDKNGLAGIGGNLKGRMGKVSEFHLCLLKVNGLKKSRPVTEQPEPPSAGLAMFDIRMAYRAVLLGQGYTT